MITRRCLGRMFLLRPSKDLNRLFSYILAVAAKRYGICLHALCVLSNHFHIVLSDPEGRLPTFERDLDSLVARSVNALHGRWESFWAPGSYSAVTLVTTNDILNKAAYVLANPVAAGLVPAGDAWPGLWCAAGKGGPRHVKRPKHFFRADGPLPAEAVLEFECPPGFESVDSFRKELLARVKELEERAAVELATAGRTFLGVRGVMAQDPEARPTSREPRRQLNPRVACGDKWRRIETLQRLKAFLSDYREAWQSFARGVRDTVFPHGTYWMRVAYGVPCASAG